jgi:hypothetical protein
MLLVLIWFAAVALGAVPAAAQSPPTPPPSPSMVRFGVRVLEAWNSSSATGPHEGRRSTAPSWTPTPTPSPPPASGARGWVPTPGAPPGEPSGAAPPDVDHRLKLLLPKLRALFRFEEFTPIGRQIQEGPLGTMQRFSIPGDRWLDVTPDQLHGPSVRMHVRLVKGEHAEMNASLLASPGAPAILGGPPYGRGVLIIILWANPNPRVPGPAVVPRRSP